MRQTSRHDVPIWSWGVVVAVGAVALGGWLWQPAAAAEPKTPPPPSIAEAFNVAASKRTKPTKRAAKKPAARPAARRPAARPAARASATIQVASNTLAVLHLASPTKLLRDGMRLLEQTASKELETVSKKLLQEGLGQILPQLKSMKLHRAAELLPSMLKPLGLDLSKPIGVLVMKGPVRQVRRMRRASVVPVVYVTVDRVRLLATLQLLGFSPKLREQGGATFLTVGKAGTGSALGVMLGDRLYITVRTPPHPIVGVSNEAQLRAVLANVAQQKEPLKRAFADAGRSDLWKQLQAGTLSGVLVAPKLSRLAGILPPHPALSFVQSLGGYISMTNHRYQSYFFARVHPKLAPVLAPLSPGAGAKDLFASLPRQLALFAQAHVDLKKLMGLPQLLVSRGILPPQLGMLARMQVVRFKMAAKRQGIDVDKLAALFSGQFLSGIAWDQALRAHLKHAPLRGLYKGHLHGAFALLRARSAAAGPKLLQEIQAILAKLNASSRSFKGKLTTTKATLQGVSGVEIKLKEAPESMFLLNKGDLVAFAGSKRTAELLAAVWQGAAPSLAQRLKQDPKMRVVYGPSSGNVSCLVPDVVRQILTDRGLLSLPPALRRGMPPQVQSIISGFLKTRALRFQTLFRGTQFETRATFATYPKAAPKVTPYNGPKSGLPSQGVQMLVMLPAIVAPGWPLAGLPIGISAAVAIPAFLKFIRKSKTSEASLNLKALGDGAVAFFDAEHANASGDPMPKHFPSHVSPLKVAKKRSVSTWPKTKPCANGKPMYPRNVQGWNKEPWRSLKFAVTKKHYFQYTYITEGTGRKATFTLIARADLDCDGKLSKYVVRGKVNPTTGEVERTNMIVYDGLE